MVILACVDGRNVSTAQPEIVREMALELVAHQIDLSDDVNPDIDLCLINGRWLWRDIRPHIGAAVLEAKQIILMREMGLEPCQS